MPTITVPNETMRSATRRVQEALSQKYDTFVQEIGGVMRVRVENSSKTVEVSDTPNGVEVETDLGSSADLAMVRREFEGEDFSDFRDQMTVGDSDSQTQPDRPERNGETRDERIATTNQMGQVHKPFSKQEAGYVPPEQARTSEEKCKNCAHYDDNGNCHIVPNIDPNGYCEEFYADVAFFAHGSELPNEVSKVNLSIWGDKSNSRLEGPSPAKILADIEELFEERFDERDIQM